MRGDVLKYDTEAKRIKFVKGKGNIITFKETQRFNGVDFIQICVTGFKKQRGAVKIIGFGKDSPWFHTMDDLIDAIDWERMEDWHAIDGLPNSHGIMPDNHLAFINEIKSRMERGLSDNKKSMEKLAASFHIFDKTHVKELIELTIVEIAREISSNGSLSLTEKYKQIVKLYERQVNLSHRTSQSILLQQYSTPAPIGFLAGIFCGVDKFIGTQKKAFEPSAGNGLLTVAAWPPVFFVNEIDRTRSENLWHQKFKEVFKVDASKDLVKELGDKYYRAFHAVITNPPFGRHHKKVIFDGYAIDTLEHLMAIRALETMKDEGRAAIIIGNHTFYDSKGRVQKGSQRIFLNYLYSHYYVADVIPINGRKLYSRQGTGFNTRLILIDGRKPTPEGAAPLREEYKDSVVNRFDELFDRVIESMKYSHKLTYNPSAEPPKTKQSMNSEIEAALKGYQSLKPKYKDAIILIREGETYYSFLQDAKIANEILKIETNSIHLNGRDYNYINFPEQRVDVFMQRIIRHGHRVGLAEMLKEPNKRNTVKDEAEALLRETEQELRRLENGEDLGAPYLPASEACVVLNTVVPDSMEYETRQALEFIKSEVGGNIDEFVRQRLGYASKIDLCKALSAEQTDAVAMAIYNIEAREQGMIIGDQTGIGKGRIAASMIRYAVLRGLKPIFITEKPNLFSDIYRDLIAIGSGHLVPFIVNAKESKTDIKDENGNLLHQALAPAEQQVFFRDKRIPGNCDFVLATYSQFNSPERKPEKPAFLTQVARNNIIIMDESHNASGSSQTGEFLQNVVYNSIGVVFLSATFAKRPDNMPLYAMKTAISDANMNKEDLIFAINKGGVALQEVLASELVKEGQMLRRERSFEGIEVNYIVLDDREAEHRAIADNITEILREIIAFQTGHVDDLVEELDDIAAAEGKEVNIREGTSQAGVDNLPYFSKVFQVINQMLFSIKAEAVAEQAIMRLKEGKKPVIAFASTMGSFIEQMENEQGLPVSDGDVINTDFSEVLMRGLDGILRYTETTPEGEKIYKKFSVSDFAEPVREEYLRIANKIKKFSSGICISPIDLILQKIKEAGFRVAEVTGRKFEVQLNMRTGKGMVQSRKKVNTNDAFREFNNNDIDVLMINQSGSTGASAHAIVTKKVSADQVKQRVMIVLQAELNINTEVQKRGRINRTGQILLPIYDYDMSAIPAEKRLMMMLQKKLKSLDANTTSNQKQSTKILDVPDFLNKYGDKIVTQYLSENPEINKLLGDPLHLNDPDNEKGEILEDAAHKVSGRVAVLSTKMQEEFYNEISASYSEFVEYLKQIGEYDLEVETMNLQTETVSTKVVRMGKGGDSEFGTDSVLERVKANVLRKPFKRAELENIIQEALNGKTAKEIQKKIIEDYENYSEKALAEDISETETYYQKEIENIPNEKKAIKIREKQGEGAFRKFVQEREKELTEAKSKEIERVTKQNENRKQYLNGIFKFFFVGKKLQYPIASYSDGDIKVKAVFVGFLIDKKKKNPYAPSNVRLRFALASSSKYVAMPASYAKDINGIIGASHEIETISLDETLDEWESVIKESDVARNTRFIVTGNLLQAFADFKGKLVSYTTMNGEVRKGILMPEYWESEGEMDEKVSVPVSRALKVFSSVIKGNGITTDNGTSVFNEGTEYKIIVPASRQKGGDVYLDQDILALVDNNNFDKTADKMVGYLPHKSLYTFLSILQTKFNDSVKLEPYQFNLIKDQGAQLKKRNKIEILSPEQVAEEEELALMALSLEVETETELEYLRLLQAA